MVQGLLGVGNQQQDLLDLSYHLRQQIHLEMALIQQLLPEVGLNRPQIDGRLPVNFVFVVGLRLFPVFTVWAASVCYLIVILLKKATFNNFSFLWPAVDSTPCQTMSFFVPLSISLLIKHEIIDNFLLHPQYSLPKVRVLLLFSNEDNGSLYLLKDNPKMCLIQRNELILHVLQLFDPLGNHERGV